MLKKIAKIITNNFGLKVLSIIFAIVIWLVVVNIEDPEYTKVFTMNCVIENTQVMEEMGKSFEILNNSDKVTFTVSGKRSVVEKLTEADFSCTANMENIDEEMKKIPVSVTSVRYGNQLEISKTTNYIQVAVENIISKELVIQATTTGTLSADCFINGIQTNPVSVLVEGPQSIVDQVAEAIVNINVDGDKSDFTTNNDIILMDKNGTPVNEGLALEPTSATSSINILMKKKVSLTIEKTGEVPEGFTSEAVTADKSNIIIWGTSDILADINEITVTPAELNMSGVQDSLSMAIDLKPYMPEGVNIEEESAIVNVTVKVSAVEDTAVTEGQDAGAKAGGKAND